MRGKHRSRIFEWLAQASDPLCHHNLENALKIKKFTLWNTLSNMVRDDALEVAKTDTCAYSPIKHKFYTVKGRNEPIPTPQENKKNDNNGNGSVKQMKQRYEERIEELEMTLKDQEEMLKLKYESIAKLKKKLNFIADILEL